FKIIFESESLEDLIAVKIAEILRSTDGQFILNKDYMVPCISIRASKNLMLLLKRIMEMIVSRSNALRKRRRQYSDGTLETSSNDLPVYWLLYTSNTYLPILNQNLTDGFIHPKDIYQILLSLAGQLSTFSIDDKMLPQDMPLYDHSNPAKGFIKLEKTLLQLFGEITPAKNYINVGLEKKGETIFVAQVKDTGIFNDYIFYLICTSEVSNEDLLNEIPLKFRIASPDMIKKILSSATPALPIKYIARPPTGVPVSANSIYFRLEKEIQFWRPIIESSTIVIYKPSEFRELQIELIAVKKSE
ncbi:MAG: type VI secretion system baseplate subunit TssK, partial [Calditrichaceae bacterium]